MCFKKPQRMTLLNETPEISPWISLIISIIGLLSSLLVIYISNLKKSKPKVLIGSDISFFPAPYVTAKDLEWGATSFYIPMTFFNWSPNGGSIIDCRITLARKDTPNKVYDMAWSEFTEMLQEERRMGYAGFAQPLPLPPNSSITKTVVFTWAPHSSHPFTVASGAYTLRVMLWTKVTSKPQLRETFEFNISEQDANDYQTNLQNKIPLTIRVSIRETNKPNNILTSSEASKYDA
jgi:hypothetical protein